MSWTHEERTRMLTFANVNMCGKMHRNRHKSHWFADELSLLFKKLSAEVKELSNAFEDDSNARLLCIEEEAADVANFAFMIADHARRNATQEQRLVAGD